MKIKDEAIIKTTRISYPTIAEFVANANKDESFSTLVFLSKEDDKSQHYVKTSPATIKFEDIDELRKIIKALTDLEEIWRTKNNAI